MAHPVLKPARLHIPARDKTKVAMPRPAAGSHDEQVQKAFAKTLHNYEHTLMELSKV